MAFYQPIQTSSAEYFYNLSIQLIELLFSAQKNGVFMKIKQYNIYFMFLPLVCSSLLSMTVHAQTESDYKIPSIKDQNLKWTDAIPRMVDATPTLFPEESNQSIVLPTQDTEDMTWADRQQKSIRNWADRTAHKMDDWFGETNPEQPASATLRVIVDNRWNKHDDYDIKPRIRGRIKLPTLENRLSVVFGDDSLDNEIQNNIAITNENPGNNPNKTIDSNELKMTMPLLPYVGHKFQKACLLKLM